MNPLLFIPSPRSIPQVYHSLEKIPFDKYVVKNKLEKYAYHDGRDYFLTHTEYTHLVICPDDLIIDYDSFMILLNDVKLNNFSNLSGISNIDETQPDVYSCKPLDIDPSSTSAGTYYTKNTIPDEIFEAGFTGFACQFISRVLVEKLSFTGGCGDGCMDLKFTQELQKMGEKQMVEPKSFFYHMRMAQYTDVMKWKNGTHDKNEGYSVLLKKDQRLIPRLVICCSFYNDVENLKRLMSTIPDQISCIFVDGKWKDYDGPDLSDDGSHEYLKQFDNVVLVDKPNLEEWQKRNEYIRRAQELGFDYCFVIDSDEFITFFDMEKIQKSLQTYDPAFSHVQYYDSTYHLPFYRIHTTWARHVGKHNEAWVKDKQILTADVKKIEGYETRHDKTLRTFEREKMNKQYYETHPVR